MVSTIWRLSLSTHPVYFQFMDGGVDLELELDLPPGQVPDDDVASRRIVKRSPAAQGSEVPVGWKPTVHKPVPVVHCAHIFKDSHERAGERCGQWSLRGSRLCWQHSGKGNLKNVEEYRLAIVESARLKLVESADDAVTTLLELLSQGTADNVRLKAATEVLDRVGIKTADQLQVDVQVTDRPPAEVLSERLSKLRGAATAALSAAPPPPEPTVIEGEVVDE